MNRNAGMQHIARRGSFIWFQKPLSLVERVCFYFDAGLTLPQTFAAMPAEYDFGMTRQAWYAAHRGRHSRRTFGLPKRPANSARVALGPYSADTRGDTP